MQKTASIWPWIASVSREEAQGGSKRVLRELACCAHAERSTVLMRYCSSAALACFLSAGFHWHISCKTPHRLLLNDRLGGLRRGVNQLRRGPGRGRRAVVDGIGGGGLLPLPAAASRLAAFPVLMYHGCIIVGRTHGVIIKWGKGKIAQTAHAALSKSFSKKQCAGTGRRRTGVTAALAHDKEARLG